MHKPTARHPVARNDQKGVRQAAVVKKVARRRVVALDAKVVPRPVLRDVAPVATVAQKRDRVVLVVGAQKVAPVVPKGERKVVALDAKVVPRPVLRDVVPVATVVQKRDRVVLVVGAQKVAPVVPKGERKVVALDAKAVRKLVLRDVVLIATVVHRLVVPKADRKDAAPKDGPMPPKPVVLAARGDRTPGLPDSLLDVPNSAHRLAVHNVQVVPKRDAMVVALAARTLVRWLEFPVEAIDRRLVLRVDSIAATPASVRRLAAPLVMGDGRCTVRRAVRTDADVRSSARSPKAPVVDIDRPSDLRPVPEVTDVPILVRTLTALHSVAAIIMDRSTV